MAKRDPDWHGLKMFGIMMLGCVGIGVETHSWKLGFAVFGVTTGAVLTALSVIENHIKDWMK